MENPHLRLLTSLTVHAEDGDHSIKLMYGDITRLRIEEKVDVLFVSAFPGDYSPTPTSVIGALRRNLNLNVSQLAKDKQEDLRRHFHCWWSKPLPDNLPYRQLLCFESPFMRNFRHPAELVGDVFRALVPAFKNEEKSIITPILASGDQNFSKTRMLRTMVDAAVDWIRAGLSLKCLSIVIYTRNPDYIDEETQDLIERFEKIRKKLEKAQVKEQEQSYSYDIYFSYHERNIERVNFVKQWLKKEKPNFRIFSEKQEHDSEKVWQDDVFNVMKNCERILTFISPAYLSSSECIDQYNLAYCYDRSKRHKKFLTPIYTETITAMPTYMALKQYIDCREKDGNPTKMETGLKSLVAMFEMSVRYSLLRPIAQHYDVFISYSHGNREEAKALLKHLEAIFPDVSMFFDSIELKAGSAWQQTLYNALDNTDVVIALISPEYLNSAICMEEYSLALAKHLSSAPFNKNRIKGHDLDLIPVMIKPMEKLPRYMMYAKLYNASEGKTFSEHLTFISHHVVQYLKKGIRKDGLFSNHSEPWILTRILENVRYKWFNDNYEVDREKFIVVPKGSDSENPESLHDKMEDPEEETEEASDLTPNPSESDTDKANDKELTKRDVFDIAWICSDYAYGLFCDTLIKSRAKKIVTNIDLKTEKDMLDSIEKSKLVVPLISPTMVSSGKDIDELHVALARHRSASSSRKILYPLQISPPPNYPTYVHLIKCNIGLQDHFWDQIVNGDLGMVAQCLPGDVLDAEAKVIKECGKRLPLSQLLALSVACDDILSTLNSQSDESLEKNIVLNNIVKLNYESQNGDIVDAVEEIHTQFIIIEKGEVSEEKQTQLLTQEDETQHSKEPCESKVQFTEQISKDSDADSKSMVKHTNVAVSCLIL